MRLSSIQKNLFLPLIRRVTAFVAVFFSLAVLPLQGQPADSSFSYIKPTLAIFPTAFYHTLSPQWEGQSGAAFYLELPFYYGVVYAGLRSNVFQSELADLPDFRSTLFSLHWGKYWQLPADISFLAGGYAGSALLRFAENEFYRGLGEVTESELSLGLQGRLDWQFSNNWHLFISGDYNIIFTSERIREGVFLLGVGRKFKSPKWLQKILR